MRVAIIGAGAAGLVSARHCTDPSINFTCEIFEQMDQLGGTWIYTPNTDVDEYGIPIHTSMYTNLVTNLPKEIMEFPDFSFPNYNESFLTQDQVLKYLQDYAKHYDLEKYIKYRHLVKKVTPLGETKWSVLVTNLITKTEMVKEYDAVMICNGHFSKPIIANINGQEKFDRKQMHSHAYRNAKDFQNQTVLLIGGGPSGVDISLQLSQYATRVILSHRNPKLKYKFPATVIIKPAIAEITKTGAIFQDGTSENVDTLIYCTGYEYDFPFLAEECGITVDKNAVQPLFKHVVNIHRSTMGFIGIPFLVMPFPLYHYQSLMFLKHINEDILLPTKDEMFLDLERDIATRKKLGFVEKHTHRLGADFQMSYFKDLANISKIPPVPPVKFKIYTDVSMKYDKKPVYKIIDDENFQKNFL